MAGRGGMSRGGDGVRRTKVGGGIEHFRPWEGSGIRVRVRVWPVCGRGVRDELH